MALSARPLRTTPTWSKVDLLFDSFVCLFENMHLLHIYFLYIHSPPKKKTTNSVSPRVSSPSHKTPKKKSPPKSPQQNIGNRKNRANLRRPYPQPAQTPPGPYPRGGCRLSTGGDCTCGPKSTSADRSARSAARQARDEGDGACGACGDAWGEVWNGWTGGGGLNCWHR